VGGVRTFSLSKFDIHFNFRSSFFSFSSDDDPNDPNQKQNRNESSLPGPPVGPNPFLDIPQNITAVEYKKGYVMRKCCYDSNNKKSKFFHVRGFHDGKGGQRIELKWL
jgi:hypothetical protein